MGQSDRGGAAIETQCSREESRQARTLKLLREQLPTDLLSRSVVGLLALMGIGAAVVGWQSNLGQAAPELPSASVPGKKNDQPTGSIKPAVATIAQAKPAGAEPQAAPKAASDASPAATMSPELARQVEGIVRDLAKLEQGLEQLKAEQSRMSRENAELSEQFKAMREVARHNVELTEELKVIQAQTAREMGGLVEQLKANQGLMTTVMAQLKDSQEQAARLASEQKQRIVRKPAPKLAASPAGQQPPQPQAPRNLQSNNNRPSP